MAVNRAQRLRGLPSVEALASSLEGPKTIAIRAAREVINAERQAIEGGESNSGLESLASRADLIAKRLARPSLRRVINATGVVLHTNLGRAPLAAGAAAAAADIATGYSNLEYDLKSGKRSSRSEHVENLIRDLSGADAAIAVNNNAAAVLLAVTAIGASREVVVGRDSLIEIGGSFRIPEILALSGAQMVEVGTTNRTRIEDYERAITDQTAALLSVHHSNFRTIGFTESTPLAEMATLAKSRGIALIYDLGSGATFPIGDEPVLLDAVAAGATLACCSADKLLGGPQAGIIAGQSAAVDACRQHPLARALRLDKMQVAALEWTLRALVDGSRSHAPATAMLERSEADLRQRAERLALTIGAAASVSESSSTPGGGTLPTYELPGPVCRVDPGDQGAGAFVAALRSGEPAVISRIATGAVLLDPRTVADDEFEPLAQAARAALD